MRAGKSLPLGVAAILLAAASAAVSAAAPPLRVGGTAPFTRLGTRDSLPNASVMSIAQDAQGFLWFGTQGGLARYDGRSFKLFSHVPLDPNSLPSDAIQALCPDGDALWVGTSGGLARLDLVTERFVSYANDAVACVARDRSGGLWFGGLSGLGRLDLATGRFERFRHEAADPGSLPAGAVRALKIDRQGRLWVGCAKGGLALFDYAARRFRSYPRAAASDDVTAIDEDTAGRLWIGGWGTGLSLFDPATGRFEDRPVADYRISSLCAAEEGVVYVGTRGGGLFKFDIASGTYTQYRASGSELSLPGDNVSSMLRDGSGELWIGTEGGGVGKLAGGDGGLEVIVASEDGMPSGRVSSLLIDRLGYLWVGIQGQGIARRDPFSGVWRRYRLETGNPASPPGDIVSFIREDRAGRVWAGGSGGLAYYDRGENGFSSGLPVLYQQGSWHSDTVSAMVDDPGGGAWIGTVASGLYFLPAQGSSERNLFSHFSHDQADDSSLSDDSVTALGFDDSGRLWVGTNKGLNRVEAAGGLGFSTSSSPAGETRFIRYLYDSAKPGGVLSDSITTIFLDSSKELWIGTRGGGLMRYEPETDSFVSYLGRDGLPSANISSVLEDAKGKLWVATQGGLAVYDRSSGRFRGVSASAVRRGPEFFSGAFRARDGSLYFGALDRIYRVDPARYAFNDRRPPIVLSSVTAKGRTPIGPAAASRLGRLDLTWRENSLTINFAALDYRDPARILYSYRLEGFEPEWSAPGPERTATYTNLPGGRYLFRVRASNDDGLWNEEGAALPIKVGFAPWANPWALVLYAIILAGGGYAFASLRSRASLRAARDEADSLLGKLIETSASISTAATIDELTGLPNRLKLHEHIDLAFERAIRMKLELAVVMVDIDHFKPFNDRFGRVAGDECLCRVARAISACVRRSSDVMGRYGGEEFLFILEETGIEGALAVGEAAREAVESLEIPGGNSLQGPGQSGELRQGLVVTVSVGCASGQPEAGHAPAFLVESAEKALMAAKQRGRNRTSD